MSEQSKSNLIDNLLHVDSRLKSMNLRDRLIMTDDVGDLRSLRERASAGRGNHFFFGIALPASLQSMVDSFVRDDKEQLMDLIENSPGNLVANITVSFDEERKAYLVKFADTGCGFFISKHVQKLREQRVRVERPKRGDNVRVSTKIPQAQLQSVQSQQDESRLATQREETARSIVNFMKNSATEAKSAVSDNSQPNLPSKKHRRKSAPVKRTKFKVLAKLGG